MQTINDINHSNANDADSVGIVAIIDAKKLKSTRSFKHDGFCPDRDMYGSMEMLVFPKVYDQYYYLLNNGNVVS
jgi:DNA polymerase III alpha subunit